MKIGKILLAVLGLPIIAYVVLAFVFWPDDDLQVSYDQADRDALDLSYENGLDADRQRTFYHLSQGSEIFPIRLLRALEDPRTGKPFMENLDRFGLLPDPDREDGLAVGLSVANNRFTGGVDMVGLTCAACHVAEIRYDGRAIRVDGAPNLFDMQAFYAEMILAARAAAENASVGKRVAQRLFLQSYDQYGGLAPLIRPFVLIGQALGLLTNLDDLKARLNLARVIVDAINLRNQVMDCDAPGAQCTAGFGRLDAFNGTRNFMLGRLGRENLVQLNAPVKFPPIWGFRDYAWFEWTQNTNSVMERNVTETLGAGATVQLEAEFDESGDRFSSSVPTRNLNELEKLAYYIEPPTWPEDILGEIDADLAAQGRRHFLVECAGCHEYDSRDYGTDGLLALRTFSPRAIGTDPSAAIQIACPVPNPGDLPVERRSFTANEAALLADCSGVPNPPAPFEAFAFSDVLTVAVGAIKEKAYANDGISESERREFEDSDRRGSILWRDSILETGRPYAARPLDGIWAAAPYLHNGSVPTLYDLLQPPNDRPKSFALGHRDYDPVKVGYRTDVASGQAKYFVRTDEPGNSNAGHVFGTRLSEQGRMALIEYLKTR